MLMDILRGDVFAGEYAFLVLACAAAWITGKNCAQLWRSLPVLVFYILALGIGLRFIHFALYAAPMFSLARYLLDTLVLLAVASFGYQAKRANQMTSQYHWLYEKTSPLTWRDR
jgi:small-conductance mechanosensitive channel